MPSSKSHNRRGQELERSQKARILEKKAASFHGKLSMPSYSPDLRRPKTLPDLLTEKSFAGTFSLDSRPKLTKLLLNVTIQGSLGPVQVLMPPEKTVSDLIAVAVRQYSKECRRPILPSTDPALFDLHYSQFSLESLGRDERLMELGSRNFFLCTRKTPNDGGDATASCSKEAENNSKIGIAWLKFMDFLF